MGTPQRAFLYCHHLPFFGGYCFGNNDSKLANQKSKVLIRNGRRAVPAPSCGHETAWLSSCPCSNQPPGSCAGDPHRLPSAVLPGCPCGSAHKISLPRSLFEKHLGNLGPNGFRMLAISNVKCIMF